ncbi:MAG: hypothetical protein ACKV0T_11175 [Planctomycetales bacterium]
MRNHDALFRQALLPLLSVAGAIGLLLVAIHWIRGWLRDNDDPAMCDHELLSEYRELKEQGELTDEEYRIISCRIAPRTGPAPAAEKETFPPGGTMEKS